MENNDTQYMPALIATASITRKPENQDSHAVFEGQRRNGVFIADGLGGNEYSRFARDSSQRVIRFFSERAAAMDTDMRPCCMETLYREAKMDLAAYANEMQLSNVINGDDDRFGTTAITLFEDEDKIRIAYTGNGGIWHIRANLKKFAAYRHFPWNAINLLNPHSIPEKGKEALYKLISNSTDFEESVPSIIEITKDRGEGDIIMICTDGIYSADQRNLGKGQNENEIWLQFTPAMIAFFEHLKKFVLQTTDFTPQSLIAFLDGYLADIRPLLYDDATIGILFTAEAVRLFQEI